MTNFDLRPDDPELMDTALNMARLKIITTKKKKELHEHQRKAKDQ